MAFINTLGYYYIVLCFQVESVCENIGEKEFVLILENESKEQMKKALTRLLHCSKMLVHSSIIFTGNSMKYCFFFFVIKSCFVGGKGRFSVEVSFTYVQQNIQKDYRLVK